MKDTVSCNILVQCSSGGFGARDLQESVTAALFAHFHLAAGSTPPSDLMPLAPLQRTH